MDQELEQALEKVANRLESLEDFSGETKGRIAKLEEQTAQLSSGSSKSEAKLAEVEPQLRESQDKVARLEEENARLRSPEEKARWLEEFMTPENFAVVATKMGYKLPEATEAEVAEHEEEREPTIIQGKTDKPGFRYLPNIDMSIKEEAQEEGE